jgi:hypothetical protein
MGELDALIKRMGSLSRAGERACKKAGPKLLKVAQAQWQAGIGPSGEAWPKTKDGKVALQDLTAKITATAEGESIILRAPLLLTFHQGKRPVFPGKGEPLPASWQKTIDDALRAELEKASP